MKGEVVEHLLPMALEVEHVKLEQVSTGLCQAPLGEKTVVTEHES